MQPSGAAHFFDNQNNLGQLGSVGDANLNSLEMGGNVYQSPNGPLLVNVTPLLVDLRVVSPTIFAFLGATDVAVTANATNFFYLDSAGTLVVNTTGFLVPPTAAFRLASVVAGATAISSIADARCRASMLGASVNGFAGSVAAVNALPVAPGATAFATDGRKIGEGPAAGTGVLAYFDGTSWFRASDDTVLAA